MKSIFLKKIIWSFFLTLATVNLFAKEYYILPDGSGNLSGTSWLNAAPASDFNSILSSTISGDKILFGSGNYSSGVIITKTNSGDPIYIEGVNSGSGIPIFDGNWLFSNPSKSNGSWAAFEIQNASNIVIKNFKITEFMHGIFTSGTSNSKVLIDKLEIYNVREGMKFDYITSSIISNCSIVKYAKRGIRLNLECSLIEIRDCLADGNNGDLTWKAEAFPFGFVAESNPNVHDITYRRCIAKNNYHEQAQTIYWNGDGFVAEIVNYNLKYYDCEAYDNSDGGWDDKSKAPYLENCISFRNKRNFRFWNVDGNAANPVKLYNCIGGYAKYYGGIGSNVGLWSSGYVLVEKSTFHNNKTAAVSIEENATQPQATVILKNCILSSPSNPLTLSENQTSVIADSTNRTYVEGTLGINPNYKNPTEGWTNQIKDDFNSLRYIFKKGYFNINGIVNGMEDKTDNIRKFTVYPNPSNAFLKVKCEYSTGINIRFEILDITGKRVKNLILEKEETYINTEEISEGLYLYNVVDQGKVIDSGKLIIN